MKGDVRYVEIEFEGVKNLKRFGKYGDMKIKNGVNYLRVDDEKNKDKIINEIIKNKGKLLSVVPVKNTLEEHFMRVINE